MGKALKAEGLSSYSQRPHKSHVVMGAPAIQGTPKSSRSGTEHYSDGGDVMTVRSTGPNNKLAKKKWPCSI